MTTTYGEALNKACSQYITDYLNKVNPKNFTMTEKHIIYETYPTLILAFNKNRCIINPVIMVMEQIFVEALRELHPD